jgi:hypothetical protein
MIEKGMSDLMVINRIEEEWSGCQILISKSSDLPKTEISG